MSDLVALLEAEEPGFALRAIFASLLLFLLHPPLLFFPLLAPVALGEPISKVLDHLLAISPDIATANL